MDQEQQIRINFLDEAQECFDSIESVIIGFSSQIAEASQLDLALRSAHSVKGGAGMMGFTALSKIAHQLEDFFKILRVRYQQTQIETTVETLLLQCVDVLQQASDLHREGVEIPDEWLDENAEPIFMLLRENLGEVQAEDEDKLLNTTEEIDATLELVEEGLDSILNDFTSDKIAQLDSSELAQELMMVSDKIITLARIAEIEPLIELCEVVYNNASQTPEEQINTLAKEALTAWQRSHGLIFRGNLSKIPRQLASFSAVEISGDDSVDLDSVDDLLLAEQLNQLQELDVLDELADLEVDVLDTDVNTSLLNEELAQLQATLETEDFSN